MSDASRLEWIREKTCSGLGVEVALFDQYLQTEPAAALITQFLDGGAFTNHLLFAAGEVELSLGAAWGVLTAPFSPLPAR